MTTSKLRLLAPKPAPAVPRQAVLQATLPDGRTVDVLRIHNPRSRGMRLSVTERGIRLTAPPRTSDVRAIAFVHQHADWLVGQLAHTFGSVQPLRIGETATLPLRGVDVPVQWIEDRFLRVEGGDEGVRIRLPDAVQEEALRRSLADFYLAQARADVGRWLPQYLPSFPRAPRSISIRPLSSLWGSIGPDDRMRLDLALVLTPPRAFEYVLVHELCHLLQSNHSPAFWHEVDIRFCDWEAQRDYLRTRGRPIKAALAAVCGRAGHR